LKIGKQCTTRGLVNCRCSGYSSGAARIKSSCNLIGNRPQTATFHTANRWQQV